MTFAELLPEAAVVPGLAAVRPAGLAVDSRGVKPGDVFFAVPGNKADGLAYVPQAVDRGAKVVVSGTAVPNLDAKVFGLVVRMSGSRWRRRRHDSIRRQPDTIVAVTGTSGKTSVAAFVRQIWAKLGRQAASLGTVGLVSPSGETKGALTTPDAITLHKTLDELARQGVTHLAVEASSHGLDQHRLDGLRLAAGGFTNLSRDHLDYHPTLEATISRRRFGCSRSGCSPAPERWWISDSEAVAPEGRLEAADVGKACDIFTTGRAGQEPAPAPAGRPPG